jgi:predicted nucleotidyltransferase component of viral defense system
LVLLKKLQQIPLFSELRLVGGTALALQLGHRNSIDLDFFGHLDVDHEILAKELEIAGFELQSMQGGKNIHQFSINGVKVDFVNYPYKWLKDTIITDGVRMAGLQDISAMKLSAITNRGTKKDFVDIYFLLQRFTLKELLDFYTEKYVNSSVFMVLRSLCYFDDAEEQPMPKMFISTEWADIKTVIKESVRGFANQS